MRSPDPGPGSLIKVSVLGPYVPGLHSSLTSFQIVLLTFTRAELENVAHAARSGASNLTSGKRFAYRDHLGSRQMALARSHRPSPSIRKPLEEFSLSPRRNDGPVPEARSKYPCCTRANHRESRQCRSYRGGRGKCDPCLREDMEAFSAGHRPNGHMDAKERVFRCVTPFHGDTPRNSAE